MIIEFVIRVTKSSAIAVVCCAEIMDVIVVTLAVVVVFHHVHIIYAYRSISAIIITDHVDVTCNVAIK